MTNITSKLFEFNVIVEEKSVNTYCLNVMYLGDDAFYERLISVAKNDSVVLTWRSLPFFMKYLKYLQLEKYLFYLENSSKDTPVMYERKAGYKGSEHGI